mgnify:CR=1 FL=1
MAQFNEEFYLENNPEALASDKTAFEHFVTEGWESGAQANAEGEVLSGDDIVTEAVALSGEALTSLISEMDADDMRALDADSEALDVPALMTTSFDVFKNMDASETSKLVEDTPESLAGMEVDDFQFLESGGTFDVGQTMDGLDESITATVLKSLGGEALEYVDAEEAFDMGVELTEMSDENLATMFGGMGINSMTFMDDLDGWDMGATMSNMDSQNLSTVMGGADFGFMNNLGGFDMGSKLADMDDTYLSKAMTGWSESSLDGMIGLDDFDMAGRLGGMDSTLRGGVIGGWGTASLEVMDKASTDFNLSDVVFTDMDQFTNMDAGYMVGLLGGMDLDSIKSAASKMSGEDLQFLDSAEDFDLGATMGAVDDGLFADLMGGWGSDGLSYMNSMDDFDMGAKVSGMDDQYMATMFGSMDTGAMSFMDDMDDFDMGGRMGSMDDQYMASMIGNFDKDDLGFFDGMDDFDLASELGEMDDQYLGTMLGQMNADEFTFFDNMDGFDLGGELGSMDDQYMSTMMGGLSADSMAFMDDMDDFDLTGQLQSMDDQYKLSMTVGMDVEAIALLNQKDIWQGSTEGSLRIANDGVLVNENGTEMVFSDGRMKVSAYEDWVEDEDFGSGSVEWAERHGQGDLDVAEDGTITNQNGEVMVVDSEGNLAPAPSALGEAIDQANAPTAASESINDDGFGSASVEWAEANGQGDLDVAEDGTITNQNGEVMVLDSEGNLAPAPRDVAAEEAAPAASESINDAGFGSASVEWAEANGQGELDVTEDGTITNQYGEVMVVDSSGNLAPAPKTEAVAGALGIDAGTGASGDPLVGSALVGEGFPVGGGTLYAGALATAANDSTGASGDPLVGSALVGEGFPVGGGTLYAGATLLTTSTILTEALVTANSVDLIGIPGSADGEILALQYDIGLG